MFMVCLCAITRTGDRYLYLKYIGASDMKQLALTSGRFHAAIVAFG